MAQVHPCVVESELEIHLNPGLSGLFFLRSRSLQPSKTLFLRKGRPNGKGKVLQWN